MIVLQNQLGVGVEVAWLHGGAKNPISTEEQLASSGPLRTVVPTAVFNISTYFWEDTIEW